MEDRAEENLLLFISELQHADKNSNRYWKKMS